MRALRESLSGINVIRTKSRFCKIRMLTDLSNFWKRRENLTDEQSAVKRIEVRREMERKNSHPTNRDGLLYRSVSRSAATTSSPDFVLQWGNRKKLRCMKVHVKDKKRGASNDPAGSDPSQRAAVRVDRRVVRSDLLNNNNITSKNPIPNPPSTITNGYLNLRHRSSSPSRRFLRNSESTIVMKGNSNGMRGLATPERGEKKGTSTSNNVNAHHHNSKANNSSHNNDNHQHAAVCNGGSGSSETAHDVKTGGGVVWPKFMIALTNKEKEEDFMAIKGSKLPQRPKKRAKLIQRTLNLVSPGTWLCDLTLERYEVREKKVSKKRPRGLRAMGNMIESESE